MSPTEDAGLRAARARVGTQLNGKWRLDQLLDVGGMGAVYSATHRNGKRVAVKVLHAEYAAEETVRERFLREGYVANKIGHPGAVSVLDDDTTEDGTVFLVMELLEGESVEARIQRHGGILPTREVLEIAAETLAILGAAHTQGIIHRDIKPANLFVTRSGEVKLLDFGLARVRDPMLSSLKLTSPNVVLGTSSYMSPEQARAKWSIVDGRSDVFAVGAVMYRALANKIVHEGKDVQRRLYAAMTEPAQSLGKVAPTVPAVVVKVVDKALAFEMDQRWPTAEAMRYAVLDAFEQLKDAAVPSVRMTTSTERMPISTSAPSIVVDISLGDLNELPATSEILEVSAVLDEDDTRNEAVPTHPKKA